MTSDSRARRAAGFAVALILLAPLLTACDDQTGPTAADYEIVMRIHDSKEADFRAEVGRCGTTLSTAQLRAADLAEISQFKDVTTLPEFDEPSNPTTPEEIADAIAKVKEQSRELSDRTLKVEAACDALANALGTREKAKWAEASKRLQESLDAARAQDRAGAPAELSAALDAALTEGDKALKSKGDFVASEAAFATAAKIDGALTALVHGIVAPAPEAHEADAVDTPTYTAPTEDAGAYAPPPPADAPPAEQPVDEPAPQPEAPTPQPEAPTPQPEQPGVAENPGA